MPGWRRWSRRSPTGTGAIEGGTRSTATVFCTRWAGRVYRATRRTHACTRQRNGALQKAMVEREHVAEADRTVLAGRVACLHAGVNATCGIVPCLPAALWNSPSYPALRASACMRTGVCVRKCVAEAAAVSVCASVCVRGLGPTRFRRLRLLFVSRPAAIALAPICKQNSNTHNRNRNFRLRRCSRMIRAHSCSRRRRYSVAHAAQQRHDLHRSNSPPQRMHIWAARAETSNLLICIFRVVCCVSHVACGTSGLGTSPIRLCSSPR